MQRMNIKVIRYKRIKNNIQKLSRSSFSLLWLDERFLYNHYICWPVNKLQTFYVYYFFSRLMQGIVKMILYCKSQRMHLILLYFIFISHLRDHAQINHLLVLDNSWYAWQSISANVVLERTCNKNRAILMIFQTN